MNFYLSSYKFGRELNRLQGMLPNGSRVGHINNSQDWTGAEPKVSNRNQEEEIEMLNKLGFAAESLDLKKYFAKEVELSKKIDQLDGLWVSGGNTFVLRQAMKLSGFDNIFTTLKNRKGFLYGGYSAGICILCDSLKYIRNVDNPNDFPYEGIKETVWDGLNIFSFGLLPHYNSDHYESAAIKKEVQSCIDNKWLFKALSDGEVIIIENE
jgi:dipeptidase E